MSARSRLVPNRRCKTAVAYQPRRYNGGTSYYINTVRQAGQDKNAIQNAVMVLGIHRSKSEVDIQSVVSNESTTSIKRSQTHLFMSAVPDQHPKPEVIPVTREEAKVAMTTVPKKGLIKLTALGEELANPFMFEKRNYQGNPDEIPDLEEIERQRRKFSLSQGRQKMLIRRKNIQDQVMKGKHRLDEEEKMMEEQVDMEKALEEYTVADLQHNINQFMGGQKKGSVPFTRSKGKLVEQKEQEESQQVRSVTLPAINTLNVFGT